MLRVALRQRAERNEIEQIGVAGLERVEQGLRRALVSARGEQEQQGLLRGDRGQSRHGFERRGVGGVEIVQQQSQRTLLGELAHVPFDAF